MKLISTSQWYSSSLTPLFYVKTPPGSIGGELKKSEARVGPVFESAKDGKIGISLAFDMRPSRARL